MMNIGGSKFQDPEAADRLVQRIIRDRKYRESLIAFACVDSEECRWFAIRCAPGKDRSVHDQLVENEIECWLPERKKKSRAGRRGRAWRMVPVFEGYLFVRVLPRNEAFLAVLSMKGVVGFIAADGAPKAIGIHEVNAVRTACGKGQFDDGATRLVDRFPEVGEAFAVEVNGVTLRSVVTGVYRERKRITVRQWLFGQQRDVTIGLDEMAKAG